MLGAVYLAKLRCALAWRASKQTAAVYQVSRRAALRYRSQHMKENINSEKPLSITISK